MRKILLATDGSEISLRVASQFRYWFDADNDHVVILHVVHTPDSLEAAMEVLDGETDAAAARVITMTKQALDLPEQQVTTLIRLGTPADTICEVARTEGCDLILIGHRGHSAIADLLLGSVSSAVVHQAPVSVLVCR